jgi:hypothetical protein
MITAISYMNEACGGASVLDMVVKVGNSAGGNGMYSTDEARGTKGFLAEEPFCSNPLLFGCVLTSLCRGDRRTPCCSGLFGETGHSWHAFL